MSRMIASVIVAAFLVTLAAATFVRRPLTISTQEPISVEHVAVSRKLAVAVPQATMPQRRNASASIVQIARSANVTVLVDGVEKAVDRIGRLTRERDGDILSLDSGSGTTNATASQATVSARVPANRFDDFLRALSNIGTVREEHMSAQDQSGTLVDSAARLRNLRTTEADIRRIMDRSGSVADILGAETQLSQVREQIETLQSELTATERSVTYATVDITLVPEIAPAPVDSAPQSQLAGAWRAATHALIQTITALIGIAIWAIVFAPLAAALSIGILLIVRQRRRLA